MKTKSHYQEFQTTAFDLDVIRQTLFKEHSKRRIGSIGISNWLRIIPEQYKNGASHIAKEISKQYKYRKSSRENLYNLYEEIYDRCLFWLRGNQ